MSRLLQFLILAYLPLAARYLPIGAAPTPAASDGEPPGACLHA